MRALFTTDRQLGNFHRLVPMARALEAVGHLVAFASMPDLASTVEACGFRLFPLGLGAREQPDLIAWCEEWNPDIIVTASSTFAGTVAAKRCQIPCITGTADELFGFDAEGKGVASPAVIVAVLEQLVLRSQSTHADSRNR